MNDKNLISFFVASGMSEKAAQEKVANMRNPKPPKLENGETFDFKPFLNKSAPAARPHELKPIPTRKGCNGHVLNSAIFLEIPPKGDY